MIKRIVIDVGVFLILFVAIIFVGWEVQSVLLAINTKHALEASPVTYGELIPDKEEYVAGELIRFSYDRTCKVDDSLLPLLMLTVDSFENLNTGEIFTATSLTSRTVRRNGTEHLHALRRLSTDCTPGTYSFEGWVSIQGTLPTQPVPYASRQFKVRP